MPRQFFAVSGNDSAVISAETRTFAFMKRSLLTLILGSACLSTAFGQSMDSLFVSAPASVVPLVRTNARLDLLDYFRSGMEARVQNDLDGKTTLKALTKDFLALQLSDAVMLEIKRLPFHGDSILAVVRNVKAGNSSGRISFYTTHWRPKRIELPSVRMAQFLHIDTLSTTTQEHLLRLSVGMTYTYQWEEHRNTLTLRPSIEGMTRTEQATIRPYLLPLVWHWKDGGDFETK